MAFKKSTAWLRETGLYGDKYNAIWRIVGIFLMLLGLVLTLYYSLA